MLAVPPSPVVIAVAVQDLQPCPAAEAIGFDFGSGEALREQDENVPKLLVGQIRGLARAERITFFLFAKRERII